MENKKQPQVQNDNEILKIRRQKLADLQRAGKDPFQITKYNQSHHTDEVKALYEAHEKELLAGREPVNIDGLDEARTKEAINNDYNERRRIMDAQPIHVSIAGRMMFKRVMGKASFCNIQDLKGKIQVYVSKDAVGEECYADFKNRGNFNPCGFSYTSFKELADFAGKIPRSYRYRFKIPSEIC